MKELQQRQKKNLKEKNISEEREEKSRISMYIIHVHNMPFQKRCALTQVSKVGTLRKRRLTIFAVLSSTRQWQCSFKQQEKVSSSSFSSSTSQQVFFETTRKDES